MFIRAILGLIFLVISVSSTAQTVQCLELQPGSRTEVELTAASGFSNCFFLKGSESLNYINALSMAVGDFSYKLKMVKIDGTGSISEVSAQVSDVGGGANVNASNLGRRVGLVVVPTSNLATNKYVTVSYVVDGGNGSVVLRVVDLPTPPPQPTTTPPPTIPPYFEPCVTDKISGCEFNSMPLNIQKKSRATTFKAQLLSEPSSGQCSAAQNIPSGKHPNFNIDANLAQIAKMRQLVDSSPNVVPGFRELVRAQVMVELFATGQPYDLKQVNNKYHSTQEFGNYFYGMGAAKMGYTEDQTLRAGAVFQQWQNYRNQNHPDANNLALLVANVATAAKTGCCDNPDDPPMIKAGHQAGSNCQTDNSVASSANGGGGEGGLSEAGTASGWNSAGIVTLPRVCVGHCSSSGTVEVGPTIPVKDTK